MHDDAYEVLQFLKTIDHQDQWYGGRTYAQSGEDLALLNIFGCLRIQHPTYLDIGAHHPFIISNTALLYQRGCRGINVEANPSLIGLFERMRPEDKNVWAAVVPVRKTDTVKLNRVNESSGVNSLLPIKGHGPMLDQVEVPVFTATEVVNRFNGGQWPDLLTMDVEGLDLEIFWSINFKRANGPDGSPKVIVAEAVSGHGDVGTELRELFKSAGYTLHSWCGNNMMMVRNDAMEWCR